jgi:hypothetical protein
VSGPQIYLGIAVCIMVVGGFLLTIVGGSMGPRPTLLLVGNLLSLGGIALAVFSGVVEGAFAGKLSDIALLLILAFFGLLSLFQLLRKLGAWGQRPPAQDAAA